MNIFIKCSFCENELRFTVEDSQPSIWDWMFNRPDPPVKEETYTVGCPYCSELMGIRLLN